MPTEEEEYEREELKLEKRKKSSRICFYGIICLILCCAILFQSYRTDIIEYSMPYGSKLIDMGYVPDIVLRFGVIALLQSRLNLYHNLTKTNKLELYVNDFVKDLKSRKSIAEETLKANEQHYEVDTRFYNYVLGYHKKYSSCIYLTPKEVKQEIYDKPPNNSLSYYTQSKDMALESLNIAEVHMLDLYVKRAKLCTDKSSKDDECSLNVLDLGCGWGSFSLYYAGLCKKCQIRAVSNSETQIEYINNEAKARGYKNLKAIRVNMNNIDRLTDKIGDINKFDRIISIEMLEHMKNYQKLFKYLSNILKPNGLMFAHIFEHKQMPYHFEVNYESDWMSKHFFTGGTMPSTHLFKKFNDHLQVVCPFKYINTT